MIFGLASVACGWISSGARMLVALGRLVVLGRLSALGRHVSQIKERAQLFLQISGLGWIF